MRNLLAYLLLTLSIIPGCKEGDFLDRTPTGVLNLDVLITKEGIQKLLTGAYAVLDGYLGFGIGATPSNWLWGEVTADNAHRGSESGDIPQITPIEQFKVPAVGFPPIIEKWNNAYEGVTRANDVLKAVNIARDEGNIAEETLMQFEAEARFLRAHYHFEVKKVFDKVPFLSEDVEDVRVPNDKDIWPDIEADFQFAAEHLPETQAQAGRANRWAAQAYLAKAHMHQMDYAAAKPLLDYIIHNSPYALADNYNENFDIDFNNNQESMFAVQYSVGDGAPNDANGNWGNYLNFPYRGPYRCCGFFQPTQNLVNAFQTDSISGLPLLGFEGAADTFNQEPGVLSDQGLASAELFTEHKGTLDPRLDWTVGRRGIPYRGFGDHPGNDWIRDQEFSGPYSPKKNVWKAADQGKFTGTNSWHPGGFSALNTVLIRFAQVLLWRAEVAVEEDDLTTAMEIVNRIRRRARDGEPVLEANGVTPAANYFIMEYPPTHPTFFNVEDARKAVRFEIRLELAMEGHRFFDLVRWRVAAEVMNKYLKVEQVRRPSLLAGVTFKEEVHERMPIPQEEIDLTTKNGVPTLIQNSGY